MFATGQETPPPWPHDPPRDWSDEALRPPVHTGSRERESQSSDADLRGGSWPARDGPAHHATARAHDSPGFCLSDQSALAESRFEYRRACSGHPGKNEMSRDLALHQRYATSRPSSTNRTWAACRSCDFSMVFLLKQMTALSERLATDECASARPHEADGTQASAAAHVPHVRC